MFKKIEGIYTAAKQAFKKNPNPGAAIKSVKTNVPDTKLKKLQAANRIADLRLKGAKAKLSQTQFEAANKAFKKDDKFTFEGSTKKSETNKEAYKRIQKENTKAIKSMIDTAFAENKAKGGRVGKMGGGMMSRRFGMNKGGKIPTTPKEKKFAALAPPRDRITYSDKIAGATGRQKAAIGGMIVKLGKAGKKFLKSKEGKDKLKEMDSKKGKEFTEKMLKKLKDAGFKGGGPAMSKLPAKEERKQRMQKRATAASKFVKNRKRSFGSIMREKHMR